MYQTLRISLENHIYCTRPSETNSDSEIDFLDIPTTGDRNVWGLVLNIFLQIIQPYSITSKQGADYSHHKSLSPPDVLRFRRPWGADILIKIYFCSFFLNPQIPLGQMPLASL